MKFNIFFTTIIIALTLALGYCGITFFTKYHHAESMEISVKELSNFDYPDDPSPLSTFYERYANRSLKLVKKDKTHFDFIFESQQPFVANITFHDVDLALFMPTVPTWMKNTRSLEIITLSDREWNRQQITFDKNVSIEGGDGFEQTHIHKAIRFATFVPPGYYSVKKEWKNEYERIRTLLSVTHRKIHSVADGQTYDELELHFNGLRFLVGGLDFFSLPQLEEKQYPQGFYMPMGISVPPFYESYSQLEANPPAESSYYAMLLDEKNRWLDHHKIAIDGPVMYRDVEDPNLLHLFFLSYERHTLVSHFEIHLHRENDHATVTFLEEIAHEKGLDSRCQ